MGAKFLQALAIHPRHADNHLRPRDSVPPSRWNPAMKRSFLLLLVCGIASVLEAQEIKRDIPYNTPALERQVLDIYSTKDAKNLPVVFWIHGGGWQAGDKSSVQ